jgi:replication factor C subunit 3/5
MIRIPAPSVDDVVSVLQVVAEKERVELPDKFASTVARESGRNLRKALLMLEASKAEQFPFSDEQKARVADWERFVDDLGRLIVEEQSPIRLQIVRAKVYELLTNCIPADVVMRALTKALLRRVDDQIKHETVQWAAYYEHRMKLGSKPIFHIEAFVAKFMALYKRWVVQMWN